MMTMKMNQTLMNMKTKIKIKIKFCNFFLCKITQFPTEKIGNIFLVLVYKFILQILLFIKSKKV